MSTAEASLRSNSALAWRVWAAAAAVYLVAMFHRTSLSVAGLAAAERFHINAAQLSTFTVLQLLVYAGMQLPVGLLLDRYGSRKLLTVGIVLMTLGQLGFAFVTSYPLALLTRALVGLGDATAFLSVLRLAAVWFPPWRNPLLTQCTSLAGQLGALGTALPMAYALKHMGWEATYLGAATIGLLSGAVMYAYVIDHPNHARSAAPASHPPLLASLRVSWRDAHTRYGVWAYFVSMFLPTTLLLLWGYPWLVQGEGLSPTTASALLMLLTIASMLAGPLVGITVGKRAALRMPIYFTLLGAPVLLWTCVALWPGHAPLWLLCALMVAAGTGFAGALLSFDFARHFNPPERIGAALALVNVGGFASSILAILGIGLVLDALTPTGAARSAAAFHWAMLLPYALWGLGLFQMYRLAPQLRGASSK